MFTTLIESRRPKERTLGGTAVSVLVHAAVITLGVYVTAHAHERQPDTPTVRIDYWPVAPAKKMPHPQRPNGPDAGSHGAVSAPPRRVIVAPKKIDVDLPTFDTATAITNEHDFDGTHTMDGGSDLGGSDGAGDTHEYFESQVDKPAFPRAGNTPPRYPALLERSRVNGEVVAQFVVDTTGKVDMQTVRIVRASDALFSASLESVLPSWRFLPAEAGGKRVRQVVQLPVRFAVPLHE